MKQTNTENRENFSIVTENIPNSGILHVLNPYEDAFNRQWFKGDLHIHSELSDGHADGHIDEYAAVAQQRGFRGLYVTEHCPMPESYSHQGRLGRGQMDEYVQMVKKAAEEWGVRMDVLLGIECDWLPGMEQWLENLLAEADFHYVLGSIHCNIKDYQERFSIGPPSNPGRH